MAAFDSIIMLSPFPWDGAWHTTHFLAHHLRAKAPTLFVEPRPGWNPRESGFAVRRLWGAFTRGRLKGAGEGLHVLTSPSLPLGRLRCVAARNRGALTSRLRWACHKLTFEKPLFWAFYYHGCLADLRALGMPPFVYHCLDYFEHGDDLEERTLVREAALVLCVSEPLVSRHRAWNARTYLLPNGVATGWFDEVAQVPPTAKDDVARKERRVGFVGNLSRHVDFILLEAVARALPSSTRLILIGPVLRGQDGPSGDQLMALKTLRSLQNVDVLGFVPSKALPSCIKGLDVCLLPFRADKFTSHADPTKFYQYLAAAKPIVTTAVPAAERYKALCYLASTKAEFVASVGIALNERDEVLAGRRLEAARAHDWQGLVDTAYVRACAALTAANAAV
jgi:glycosyltransferase involved in cell wall biosynthesis